LIVLESRQYQPLPGFTYHNGRLAIKSLDLAPGGTVVGFGVDKGDAGQGGAFGEQVRGEAGAVVHVESPGDAVSEKGFLQDEGESADGLRCAEGMAHHHAGVVVDDGAQDGLKRSVVGTDLGSVHEVADPQLIEVVHLVGLSGIGAFLDRKPPLGFHHPEQGVVVDRGIPQQVLIPKLFIESLCGEVGIGLALDLDHLEQGLIQASGSSPVRAVLGLEGIESPFTVLPEPGLHGGDTDFFQTIAGKVMLPPGLLPEVVVLSPCRLGEHGADDLVAFEGDSFPDVFFHGHILLRAW